MSMILDCVHCDTWIEKWGADEEFNRGPNWEGPYCDKCWLIYDKIFKLEKRVAKLEKAPVKTVPKPRGAYDLGARGRDSCPHRPRYRNCRCK